jgi:glutamate formiminotransferase/formiminotetrahydrofolate cyclodeaminase
MNRIIECVPNFSEGRNYATVQALIAAVTSVPEVWLLDHTMDVDHHRSVLTFAGSPEAVGEASLRVITAAANLIDLRHHEGVHPRIGATDVVPFVPLYGVTMEECVELARRIGAQIGSQLEIPVFLYEQAATRSERVKLEAIRRGGLAGLGSRMETAPSWAPDFGPQRLHETAGAIVIGARPPLIAFNVNFKSHDLPAARGIAKTVRESDGGLPAVKAMGVELASRGMVQVSMNLTDYHVTPPHVAFEAVKREADRYKLEIAGAELIGLVPQDALDQAGAVALQLERFNPVQILDVRIRAAMSALESAPSLHDFLKAVAAAKPTPAGGSVAALVGALAASLGVMGTRLGHRKNEEQRLLELAERLTALVQADSEAYEKAARALKGSKESAEHSAQVADALEQATDVPMTIAELACEAGVLIHSCLQSVKPAVQSDLMVGIIMVIAAAEAGLHTVNVNKNLLSNHSVKDSFAVRVGQTTRSLEELRALCYTPPFSRT